MEGKYLTSDVKEYRYTDAIKKKNSKIPQRPLFLNYKPNFYGNKEYLVLNIG